MAELGWGRRYLMCPPQHFGVLYEINPWMREEVAVDHEVAAAQWLEAWGFAVVESPVAEFLKAGGGCRCLTLSLDTVLTA